MSPQRLQTHVLEGEGVVYHLYVPPRVAPSTPLFVTVHGRTRNAREHAEAFLSFAEAAGVVLLAPLFDADRFPHYQRLGIGPRDRRADHVLDLLVAEVALLTGSACFPFSMFGFSGGGQFAHRYAMANPARVERIALGAPGWYTFPDPRRRFPRGIAADPRFPDLRLDPSRFLRVPATVLVGELDRRRDRALNRSRRVDRDQGVDRQERGRRWVQAMNAAAHAYGFEARCTFDLLPGAGHSFVRCMGRGRMGEAVFAFLFGQA